MKKQIEKFNRRHDKRPQTSDAGSVHSSFSKRINRNVAKLFARDINNAVRSLERDPDKCSISFEPRPATSAGIKTHRSHHTHASRNITGRSGRSKVSSWRVPSINGMSNVQRSARSGYTQSSYCSYCDCCHCSNSSRAASSSHVASSWRRLKEKNRKLERALRQAKGLGSDERLCLSEYWGGSLGSTNASSQKF